VSPRNSTHRLSAWLIAAVAALSTLSACAGGESTDGDGASPATIGPELASFATKSGTWRIRASGPGFLWYLDEKPGWSSAMACNDTDQPKVVTVGDWTLLVPQHACKFAQDASPIEMDSNMIVKAIDDGRWVGYDPDIAADWPTQFGLPTWYTGSLQSYTQSHYDPAGTNGESSFKNIVGTISAQGGEYPTSRGSIDEADAELITKALNGESIAKYTGAMYNIAFAHAGYPYRTPFVDTMLRDPQKPDFGLQYEHKLNGQEFTAEVYSVNPADDWKSDSAHLYNVGWALWLATEDPRIGMLVQAAAQFALATQYEYYRVPLMANGKGNMSDYRCNVEQSRSIYNCLNAMWRARDVAERTRSNDMFLWSLARTNEMYTETEAQIQQIMDTVSNATEDEAALYALNASASPFNHAHCAMFRTSDQTEFTALARSNYQDAHYGAVPIYLRAKKGEALGKELMAKLADHMVARSLYIGGAAGVDGRRDLRGSSIPIGPCVKPGQHYEAGPLPFTDRKGWAEWIDDLDIITGSGLQPPTDSFEMTNETVAVQIDFLLKAAKQLESERIIPAVTDLDEAIAAFDAAREKTREGQLVFGLWTKHVPTID